MLDVESWLLMGPLLGLLIAGMCPSRVFRGHAEAWRRGVLYLAGLHFAVAAIALLSTGTGQLLSDTPLREVTSILPGLTIYLDGAGTLMVTLVGFVGLVVAQFSVRYLDGDPRQGEFFRDLALTIGAVSLFVVSGNLLQIWAAWALASMGIQRLLRHFPGRGEVQRAVGTRFLISRLGDGLLLAAVALVYLELGTLQLAEVFAGLASHTGSAGLTAAAWLVMLAAVSKSVQFPLHGWLPETLAAPTPVSALMHAGIVNAGGFLVIRLSPLVAMSPASLTALVVIGSITVGYGALVMMTQNSVKGALVYSTIAQMGFMMLQCGLGAFSAALLHIVAHSLYKAYAFLNSGSVLVESVGRKKPRDVGRLHPAEVVGGLVLASATLWAAAMLLQIDFAKKPGGLVLGCVFSLAMATWLWEVFRFQARRLNVSSLACGFALVVAYLGAFRIVDALLGPSVVPEFTVLQVGIGAASIGLVFAGLLALDLLWRSQCASTHLEALYVHASNGFYTELWTRWLQRLGEPAFKLPLYPQGRRS